MIQLGRKVKIILAIISGVIVVGAGAVIIIPDSVKVKMTYKSQLEDLQEYYEENYSDNKHDGFIYSNDKEGNPVLFAIHAHKDGEVADVRVLKKSGLKVKTLYRTSVAESSDNKDGVFIVFTDGLFMVGSYDEFDGGTEDASLEVHQVSGGKCNKVATYDMGNSKGLCFKYKGDELSIPYYFNIQDGPWVFGYCTPKRKDSYTCIDPSDYDMDEAEVEENANKLNKLLFGEKYSKSKQVSGFLEAYPVGSVFSCAFYSSEIGNVSDGLKESGTSDRFKFTVELMKQYDSCYKKMSDYYPDDIIHEFLEWHPENYNYVSDCYYFSKDDNENRKSYFEDIINNDIKSLSKINDSKRDSKIIKGIMLENAEHIIYESVVPGFTSEDADKLLEKIAKEELKTGSIKEEAESYEAFIKKCIKARDELEAADNSDAVSNIIKEVKGTKLEPSDNYRIFMTPNYYCVANKYGVLKFDMSGKFVSKTDLDLEDYYTIYYSKTNELLKIDSTNTGHIGHTDFVDENGNTTLFGAYIQDDADLWWSEVEKSTEDGTYYLNGQEMIQADYYCEGQEMSRDEYKAKYSEMNKKGEWQEVSSYVDDDELEEYLEKEFSEKAWRPIFEKMLAN